MPDEEWSDADLAVNELVNAYQRVVEGPSETIGYGQKRVYVERLESACPQGDVLLMAVRELIETRGQLPTIAEVVSKYDALLGRGPYDRMLGGPPERPWRRP